MEVKLGQDARDVVGDRVRADRERASDVLIALAVGQPGEYLELTRGQAPRIASAASSLMWWVDEHATA